MLHRAFVFVQFVPVFVFGSFARSRQTLPPAFCSQLLEETYGALRGWTPTEPQLLKLCSGLMVNKLRMAHTPAAAHGPCSAFATGISARRAETQGPLPPLAMLKVDWCGVHPAHPIVARQSPVQEPRRILLAPPAAAKQPRNQPFVNLDAQDAPRKVSNANDPTKPPPAPLHVKVHHGAHHHHARKPSDWESLTDQDALLRARDAILNGADDSAVMAAAGTASSKSPDATGQKHTTALVGAPQATQAGHRQGILAASLGFLHEGANWAKEEMLSTLDFVCDGHCGIQRKPVQFEIQG